MLRTCMDDMREKAKCSRTYFQYSRFISICSAHFASRSTRFGSVTLALSLRPCFYCINTFSTCV